MIDGIKLFVIATKYEVEYLNNKYDFVGVFSRSTGAVNEHRLKAKYRNFEITIVDYKNVTIQGSLHKSFRNGNNYDDFFFSDLKKSITILSDETGINAERFKIQRIEIGVNVRGSPLSFSTIEKNILTYLNASFNEFYKGKAVVGLLSKQQRYVLKIYDKSVQENLPYEVIRLELKILKSIHFKATKIKMLSDLNSYTKIQHLGKIFVSHFKKILMDNCNELEKCTLTQKENNFYLKARNIKYWKSLPDKNITSKKRSFKRIINKYANQDLTTVLTSLIEEKLNYLINK